MAFGLIDQPRRRALRVAVVGDEPLEFPDEFLQAVALAHVGGRERVLCEQVVLAARTRPREALGVAHGPLDVVDLGNAQLVPERDGSRPQLDGRVHLGPLGEAVRFVDDDDIALAEDLAAGGLHEVGQRHGRDLAVRCDRTVREVRTPVFDGAVVPPFADARCLIDRRIAFVRQNTGVVRLPADDVEIRQQIVGRHVVQLGDLRCRVVRTRRVAGGPLARAAGTAGDGAGQQGLAAARRRAHEHDIVAGREGIANVPERVLLGPAIARCGERLEDPLGIHRSIQGAAAS